VFFDMLGVAFFGLIFTPVFYVFVRWIGEVLLRGSGSQTAQPAIGTSQPSERPTSKSANGGEADAFH
jgi:hypothetical protein